MKTLTANIAKIISVAFLLGTASLAHSGTAVVTVTDNYLYESLIQAEFDIENQVHASVDQTSTKTFQHVLMAANTSNNEQPELSQTELSQTEQSQIERVIAE